MEILLTMLPHFDRRNNDRGGLSAGFQTRSAYSTEAAGELTETERRAKQIGIIPCFFKVIEEEVSQWIAGVNRRRQIHLVSGLVYRNVRSLPEPLVQSQQMQAVWARMPDNQIKMDSEPGEAKVLTTPTGVRGVVAYRFPRVRDPRGDLTVGEFESEFPFRQRDITSLAERPNIVCKLSGLVTEAAPDRQIADLCKAVDQVLCFGPQRLL
jgi:hypothetical protein